MKTKIKAEGPITADFDMLPGSARVRPGYVRELLRISNPTLYRRIKDGFLPKPAKIGGTSSWSVDQIRSVLQSLK